MRLTLAVGIKNRAEQLSLTLGSIVHHSSTSLKTYKGKIELLVIDEKSTDGLQEVLEKFSDYFIIRHIQIDVQNSGVDIISGTAPITTNLSFLLANSPYVLKFQPETLFLRDNIDFMLCAGDLKNNILFADSFHGQIKLPSQIIRDVQYDVLLLDHRAHHPNHPGSYYIITQDEDVGSALVAPDPGYPFYPWVWGCSKDLFLQSGMIDIDFMSGWAAEDDFLMLRLAQAGGNLHVVDGMKAYHMWHKTSIFRGTSFHLNNVALLNQLRDIDQDEFQRRADRNKKLSEQCIL